MGDGTRVAEMVRSGAAPLRGRGGVRELLIAAGEGDFVDLIVSCSKIFRDHQGAGGMLFAVDA